MINSLGLYLSLSGSCYDVVALPLSCDNHVTAYLNVKSGVQWSLSNA